MLKVAVVSRRRRWGRNCRPHPASRTANGRSPSTGRGHRRLPLPSTQRRGRRRTPRKARSTETLRLRPWLPLPMLCAVFTQHVLPPDAVVSISHVQAEVRSSNDAVPTANDGALLADSLLTDNAARYVFNDFDRHTWPFTWLWVGVDAGSSPHSPTCAVVRSYSMVAGSEGCTSP